MSIILAKILGLYFLGIGLAFLINPDRFRKIYPQFLKDENLLFFGATLALLFGAVIVSIHNIWVMHWMVIITILGWWSLIKGFALLIYPNAISFFSFIQDRSDTFYRLVSLVYIALGAFLLCKGIF